jgi:polyhydroxybutyrate depolymerase
MRKYALFLLVCASPFAVHCGGDEPTVETTPDGAAPTAMATASGSGDPTQDGEAPTLTPLSLPKTSAGCGKAATPSGAKGERRTVTSGGKERSFVLFVPQGYDPSRAYPLVSVFHGIGATGAQMAEFIKMQEYSAGNAIVVFPDASGGRWDMSGETDLTFFDTMRESLEGSLCVNRQRVFAVGFSNGGYFTNHLGCSRAATVRAIVPADGGFPGSASKCGKTAALVYHRTEDDVVSVSNGQKTRDAWVGINTCQKTSKPFGEHGFDGKGCVAYEGCPGTTPVVYCEDAAKSPYKHDLRDVYRVPIWKWLDAFQ